MIHEIVVAVGFSDADIEDQDVDLIAELNKKIESAKRLMFSLIASKNGRPIGQVHGTEILVVPVEQSHVVKEIHERLQDELGIANTIGVGEDAKEALLALDYAKQAAPGSIKVYSATMDDGDDLNVKPQSVATGEQEEPVQKSETYVPISPDEKQRIAQILQEVQANKPVFDSLMQQAPDVYAGVVSVVQSLALMLQEDKKAKEDHIAKMIQKITEHLHTETEKKTSKYAKQIQREIDRHAVKSKSEERKQFLEWWKKHKQKKQAERKHLQENPEHQLLFDLARGKI